MEFLEKCKVVRLEEESESLTFNGRKKVLEMGKQK